LIIAGGNFQFTIAGGDNDKGSSNNKEKATGNISQYIINAEIPDVPTDNAINNYINKQIQYYIKLGNRDN
jgi:hypothetical protein